MRIKLDENIAGSAAGRLTALGHDVHTVLDEQLGGRIDSEVWAAAQQERRFLITPLPTKCECSDPSNPDCRRA